MPLMMQRMKSFLIVVLYTVTVAARPTEEHETRIINGTLTTIEEYPFIVSLRTSEGNHTCGASILSDFWILTAAHCVGPYNQTILAGVTTNRDVDPKMLIKIESVIPHPEFLVSNSTSNDIALIKLQQPLTFSSTVQPIMLPKPLYEIDQSDPGVTLFGWGITENGKEMHLHKLGYFAVSNEECNSTNWPADWLHILPSQLCAAYPGGGKGQCSGDSGGPLVHNGTQVGIVSWSIKPCASPPYPGVFTKVSHFIEFIHYYTGLGDIETSND